ncbi:glutamate receptor ionotropic, NMDA 3A-like [Convolutriloba macropyga]|uniref:glutamate receptor ionotropic, NMDA 3A-like n=1 Tax=Convolutriloba macropyga TaxID=536237 RepID=UPI003F521C5E
MKKYLNLLISVKTTMQSNRGQQQGRVNPFDLQNVIHIALNLSDPEDVSKQLTSLQPYSHKINCVLVYSKNPSRIFDAFLKHNFLTLLASQLWILPYSVSSQFCSKESPYNPRWPPKLVIQCILGWYGPEKVVELLPHIINSSLHQVRDQMNNEPVDGYQNILQRTASTLRGNMDRVYKTELTDSGVNGEWFDFKMNSHIERQLKSVLQISPYPSPATIWGNLGEFACTVKGWEGYGCKTQETNQNKVRVLGVYNPPYWLESDYSEKEGCLGLAYQARVFSQLEHIADNRNDLAQIRCVDGFGLELLRKLASDVGFKYTVVVLNNTQFRVRQNWSHVAQLVQYKNIGIVIGQIPASVDLMKRVSFSTPYRYDSLCITVQKRFQGATIDSFLRPLNVFMFVSIGISVNIVAVSITCLEWNSPFGLSPRGRNRDKVFSLPSGLTLCWSILLGHTVDTSTPKSWSARWLMNMWAALCVYFLASYTAKLAVYMIGRTTYVELSDINDPKILSGEVKLGTLSGSYAHEHLVTFYDFHTELTSDQEHHDKSDHDGKVKELRLYNNLSHALLSLQKGEIDGIVFQRGVMEHIVSSNFNCRLYIVGNPFGHLQYSIMFAKDDLESNTWFNRYLGIYHSNMQIEDMLDKWRRGAKCDSQMLTEPKLHVDHCKGVFLMLLLGIVLGMVGNVAEQMLARFVRRYQNNEKIVALLRPLSQRVYKCVQSDGFYMPGLGSIATSFSGFWTRAKESDEEVEANDTRKYPHPSLSGSAKIRQKRNQRPSNQVVIANTNTTKPSTFVSNRMFMAALKKQKVDRTISATESTCIQNSAVQSPLMPDCHTRKLSHISGASSELPTIYPVEDGNEDCERRSSLL